MSVDGGFSKKVTVFNWSQFRKFIRTSIWAIFSKYKGEKVNITLPHSIHWKWSSSWFFNCHFPSRQQKTHIIQTIVINIYICIIYIYRYISIYLSLYVYISIPSSYRYTSFFTEIYIEIMNMTSADQSRYAMSNLICIHACTHTHIYMYTYLLDELQRPHVVTSLEWWSILWGIIPKAFFHLHSGIFRLFVLNHNSGIFG